MHLKSLSINQETIIINFHILRFLQALNLTDCKKLNWIITQISKLKELAYKYNFILSCMERMFVYYESKDVVDIQLQKSGLRMEIYMRAIELYRTLIVHLDQKKRAHHVIIARETILSMLGPKKNNVIIIMRCFSWTKRMRAK